MKRLLFILVLVIFYSCDQSEEKDSLTIISGSVQNNDSEKAKVRGFDLDIEIPITETGYFSDTLDIDMDGYYDLYVGRERTGIYLEKGKTLSVVLDFNEFDETLVYTGDLAPENNYLAAKYLMSEKERPFKDVYSLDESEFIEEVRSIHLSYIDLLNTTKDLSKVFLTQEAHELTYEYIKNLENYPVYHKYFTGKEKMELSDNFYELVNNNNFSDSLAFKNSSGYRSMLDAHFGRLADEYTNTEESSPTISYLKIVNDNLPNGSIKDKLFYDKLRYGLSPDSHLDEVYEIFKQSNTNQENLEKITERYNLLKPLQAGNNSPTFEYENHKGGTTKLSDFNGKYVYVDVWATWCGPCIREIPYLKELEKEYHDKNIAFLSISIDVEKDYDKWRNMVVEKELTGVQLMADNDWSSKFVVDYGIIGIPRFILIDTEGKIVSADAMRPSDPGLKTLLNTLL